MNSLFFITLVCAVLFVTATESRKCYQTNSTLLPDSAYNDTYESADCPNDNSTECGTITCEDASDQTITLRGCVPPNGNCSSAQYPPVCKSKKECNTCDSDNCNQASHIFMPFVLALICALFASVGNKI